MGNFEIRNVVFGKEIPVIAVPAAGKSGKEFLTAAELAGENADVLEVRIDSFERVDQTDEVLSLLKEIRSRFAGPVLFTPRTKREGGMLECSEQYYKELLTAVIESGLTDLVDIEMAFGDTARELTNRAHRNNMKVILSQHDFDATPAADEIWAAFAQMQNMGADIAKGAYMPRSPGGGSVVNGQKENAGKTDIFTSFHYNEDVDSVLSAGLFARKHLNIPYILISMGPAGQITRTWGEVFGSCMTFASLEGKGSAPGQIDVLTMRSLLKERHEKMQSGRSIFLIGFMGSGKSSVAAKLGEMTGSPVIEMDRRIEEEHGMSIPEIFSSYGQDHFRQLETDLLVSMTNEPPSVVSCGGGAVLRAENVILMKSMGKVILLQVSPGEVMHRLAGQVENRPNLKNRFTEEGIRSLMEIRKEAYERAADKEILTDGKSVSEIAGKVAHFALATAIFLL